MLRTDAHFIESVMVLMVPCEADALTGQGGDYSRFWFMFIHRKKENNEVSPAVKSHAKSYPGIRFNVTLIL